MRGELLDPGRSRRNLIEKMEGADYMASQSDLRSRRDQELIVAGIDRDPEDRRVACGDIAAIREKMMDKTLADSYPASDPPSTLPDPSIDSLRLEASPKRSRDRAA
jgi:hypothetical protein